MLNHFVVRWCATTRVASRFVRGNQEIIPLDQACRQHDLFYLTNSSLTACHYADFEVENQAWERVKSKDASLTEKFVATQMKVKFKLGMDVEKKSQRRRRSKRQLKKSLPTKFLH